MVLRCSTWNVMPTGPSISDLPIEESNSIKQKKRREKHHVIPLHFLCLCCNVSEAYLTHICVLKLLGVSVWIGLKWLRAGTTSWLLYYTSSYPSSLTET